MPLIRCISNMNSHKFFDRVHVAIGTIQQTQDAASVL